MTSLMTNPSDITNHPQAIFLANSSTVPPIPYLHQRLILNTEGSDGAKKQGAHPTRQNVVCDLVTDLCIASSKHRNIPASLFLCEVMFCL